MNVLVAIYRSIQEIIQRLRNEFDGSQRRVLFMSLHAPGKTNRLTTGRPLTMFLQA